MKSTFWILGILLLVGTFIGAKLTIDQSAKAQATSQSAAEAAKPQDRIVCWGNFDVEQGIAGLYPKQFGDVVFVASENTPVKAGALLLQVNDTMARRKVELAKIAVAAAQKQLAEAKLLPQDYELQAAAQTAAIRAVDLDIQKLELDLKVAEIRLKQAGGSDSLMQTQRDAVDNGIKMLREKKKAEEKKLARIKLQDAKLKIDEVELDLQAKEVMLREAEELVKCYRIDAPSNGRVLRVYARKGEVLGPNPRIHALEFLPEAPIIVRAEVLQEWGNHVKVGQKVTIEDDTYKGPTWDGVVKSISKWYAPTRTPIIEPFRYNDVRTLECIIEVKSKEGDAPKFLGQRVRAKIHMHDN